MKRRHTPSVRWLRGVRLLPGFRLVLVHPAGTPTESEQEEVTALQRTSVRERIT